MEPIEDSPPSPAEAPPASPVPPAASSLPRGGLPASPRGAPRRPWRRIADRWSARGRTRSLVLVASLLLCTWDPAWAAAGLAVFAAGALLHFAAKGHLVREWKLCTEGPYGWVRHPFYVANLLLDTGLFLMAGLPWLALGYAVAIFPPAYGFTVLAEEEALRARFGEAYDAYAARVPRFIPRSVPRLLRWLRGARRENLERENEISRILRSAGYPFLVASALAAKAAWTGALDQVSLPLALAAMGLALWGMGSTVVHRVEERRPLWPMGGWAVLALVALPCLPWLDDRLPFYAWLEMHGRETLLRVVGGTLAGLGACLFLAGTGGARAVGAGVLALGGSVLAEQVVLGPLVGFLAWFGWVHAEIGSPRWSRTLVANGSPFRPLVVTAFVGCWVLVEALG